MSHSCDLIPPARLLCNTPERPFLETTSDIPAYEMQGTPSQIMRTFGGCVRSRHSTSYPTPQKTCTSGLYRRGTLRSFRPWSRTELLWPNWRAIRRHQSTTVALTDIDSGLISRCWTASKGPVHFRRCSREGDQTLLPSIGFRSEYRDITTGIQCKS